MLPLLEADGLAEATIVGLMLLLLALGEPLDPGEPLEPNDPPELSEPLEPGEPLEPLLMAKIATPTMAAMTTPPTSSMTGLTAVLAGTTGAGGGAQPGGTGATGAGGAAQAGGTGATGAGGGAGAATEAGAVTGRVLPHAGQNLSPAAAIAAPQLGQKPNPVAMSISLRLAGGLMTKVRLGLPPNVGALP